MAIGGSMPYFQVIAFAGLIVASFAMLLITQTKQRVSWPGWLVPAVAVVPLAAWTLFAFIKEGHTAFWPVLTGSVWGMQIWFDRLMSVTAAFFLLQNRARAAGMRSEVWVILVIVTGSLGLLTMLARTVQLESRQTG
jgi:hypothetical protein